MVARHPQRIEPKCGYPGFRLQAVGAEPAVETAVEGQRRERLLAIGRGLHDRASTSKSGPTERRTPTSTQSATTMRWS
jgi:hypothetical protein